MPTSWPTHILKLVHAIFFYLVSCEISFVVYSKFILFKFEFNNLIIIIKLKLIIIIII